MYFSNNDSLFATGGLKRQIKNGKYTDTAAIFFSNNRNNLALNYQGTQSYPRCREWNCLDAWCNVCVWKISKSESSCQHGFGASWNETLRDSTGEIVSLSPDEIE